MSRNKIVKTRKLGEIYLNPNTQLSPDDIIKQITAIKKKHEKAENIKVYGDNEYIYIMGDRLETTEEHHRRIDKIILEWRRDYEQFLMRLMFYLSPEGKARIMEIKNKYPIWEGYPGAELAHRAAVKKERQRFEI